MEGGAGFRKRRLPGEDAECRSGEAIFLPVRCPLTDMKFVLAGGGGCACQAIFGPR